MKKEITIALAAIIFTACTSTRSVTKPITGTVTSVSGAIVTIDGTTRIWITQGPIPAIGTTVTFMPTRNHKKVNSQILKP